MHELLNSPVDYKGKKYLISLYYQSLNMLSLFVFFYSVGLMLHFTHFTFLILLAGLEIVCYNLHLFSTMITTFLLSVIL